MRARIVECSNASGSVRATPSLWDSMVKIVAVAARGGGEVDNVRRESKCIRGLLRALQGLGYRVDWVSSTRVSLQEDEGRAQARITINTSCGLLVPGLVAPLAAVRLPPGGQLVVRGTSEYVLSLSVRHVIEAVIAVGGRAWPGGGLSRLVVVEPSAYSPRGRIARLYSPPGFVAAGVVAALAAAGGGRLIAYGTGVRGTKRMAAMIHALRLAGFEVAENSAGVLVTPASSGSGTLTAEPGIHEAALLMALTSPCIGGKILLEGLPSRDEDLSELEYILKATGFSVERECSDASCSLRIDSFEPTSTVITVQDDPGFTLFGIAYTASWSRLVVSGLRVAALEGLVDNKLDVFLQQLGVNAFYEDDGDKLVAEAEEPREPRRRLLECSEPAYCVAALARLLRLGDGVVEGIERIDDVAPGVLEALLSLGVGVDIT
ncbi:hypothetical protein [Pyrodictium abyssi]|uniref:3-phosphoshikimate 1-carboxyvinyltransferase n=1 Tax=Pyrodictium abyssi TaxID=54256 RepID=A0ABM8J058_9CREN|nr:hypothetical protein PABY_15770 [Pyrodictium abyssi]